MDGLRRGEQPSISELASRHPGHETEVREFLESIEMLEEMKQGDSKPSTAGPTSLPEVFGRYRIEETLGEGGMGAVHLAHDTQLDRKVALKTPKFSKATDPKTIARFYREARSAATLRHPNICPIHDVGEIEGTHYISMAFIQGKPLSAYVNRLSVRNVARIIKKIAVALDEAHGLGVIHRDLKPANILIDSRNEPIVMDFGLARQFDSPDETDTVVDEDFAPENLATVDPSAATAAARLTQDGLVLGSPGYISPEQIRGSQKEIGPVSDVYALGVVMYELLTGQLPHTGTGSLASIFSEVLGKDAPNPRRLREDLDEGLAQICLKAMSRKPADRYQTMAELAAALGEFLKSGVDDPVPVSGDANPIGRVRAEEQLELARSMFDSGQYTAALSILEKMASIEDPEAAEYAKWAEAELPKVAARLETVSNPLPASNFQATTSVELAKKADSQGSANKLWIYVAASGASIVALIILVIVGIALASRGDDTAADSGDQRAGDRREPDEPGPPSARPDDEDSGDRGPMRRPGRDSFMARLMEFDQNGDGRISRSELPRHSPLADDFELHDVDGDNLLDRRELSRIRPPAGERRPRDRGGPGGGPRPLRRGP